MILTVTPNPALDLTWHVDRLRAGDSHRVSAGVGRAGGKGVNVARVLHGSGIDVLALTTAGGASGAEYTAELERSGIPHRVISSRTPTRRSIAVVDESLGEATLLNEAGTEVHRDDFHTLIGETHRLARTARVLTVSGSLPPGVSSASIGELIATTVRRGIPIVADLRGDALIAACRARANVVKPNRAELAEATGLDDPLRGARELRDLGARIVVASLGADGLLVVGEGSVVHARLGRRLHGNPTGAGDAAVAAIAHTLADTEDHTDRHLLPRLAVNAVAWSASAVLMPLAGDLHPDRAALEREIILEVVQ